MLARLDWASVWRTVPMRRGLATLAVAPGVLALAARLPWSSIPVLAALSAAGGALLFGVNAWCLDGRGALWRASLPVGPEHRVRGPGRRCSPYCCSARPG